MRVLLTNNTLDQRAGTELYVRDVALELLGRGHEPVAYSTRPGAVAEELRQAGVPVVSTLDAAGPPPDIIHGHHHYETQTAILYFPGVPAISYCHGWLPWQETPLVSPRILRYVAVDEPSRERLISEGGIAPDKIELLWNFFDARRFPARPPLPAVPRRALAFGHPFTESLDLPVLRAACRRCGIEFDTAGRGAGTPEADPGRRLAEYDIVFAKGRSAIEAMAVGAAVIVSGYGKLGPLVTTRNFPSLRALNFGFRASSQPLEEDLVVSHLREYDAADAGKLSKLVRRNCELVPAVDRILELYTRVLDEARRNPAVSESETARAAGRYLERWSNAYKLGPEMNPKCLPGALARYESLVRCEHELAAIKGSLTWTWTQRLLRAPGVARLAGRALRGASERARRRAGA
jgi:hypothetical protein